MRNKILFINCSDCGSTGSIIRDTALSLNQNCWDSYLCVPRISSDISIYKTVYETSMKYEQSIYCRISKYLSNPLGYAPISTIRVKKVIKRVQPDIIHIHCINSFMCDVYEIIEYIKKCGYPTVITNHAEFYYTGSCGHANECNQWIEGCVECSQLKKSSLANKYWNKMKKAFTGFERCVVTSVSPWVMQRSSLSGIMEGIPQIVIENGVDTDVFRPRGFQSLRTSLDIGPSTKVVLHVSSLYSTVPGHSKGGVYIKELAARLKDEDVLFLVVGNHYERSHSDNIRLCGRVTSREELAKYYSLADVTILTSKRETFSMPLAESLCCGTPVVGFNAGGPESIALPNYTSFCSHGDIDTLEKILRTEGFSMKKFYGNQISIDARKKYNRRDMSEKYIKLYNKLLGL